MWKRDWEHQLSQQEIEFVETRMLLRRSVRPPRKSEAQWARLGDDLMLRLQAQKAQSGRAFSSWTDMKARMLRPALVTALLAIAVAGGLFVMIDSRSEHHRPSIVRVQGTGNTILRSAGSDDIGSPLNPMPGMRLDRGTSIETAVRGSLIIQIDPATALELGEKTRARLIRSTGRSFVVAVERGNVTAQVGKRRPGHDFTVLTPTGRCRVVGTAFRVEVDPATTSTRLMVTEGTVAFSHRTRADLQLRVESGEAATLSGESLVREQSPSGVEEIRKKTTVMRSFLEQADSARTPMAMLEIGSTPSGAEVYIDGLHAGVTPVGILVPAGRARIAVTHLTSATFDTVIQHLHGHSRIFARLRNTDREPDTSRLLSPMPQRPRIARTRTKQADRGSTPAPSAPPAPSATFTKALLLIESGECVAGAPGLDSIMRQPELTTAERRTVLEKRVSCLKRHGDIRAVIPVLQELYIVEENRVRRENLLWEIITIRNTTLRDSESIEMDLVEYLIAFPGGIWTYDAYRLLAETQYILGKFESSARTYEKLIRAFPGAADLDHAVYALAHISSQNLEDCHEGLKWYSRIMRDFPNSAHRENAMFWKAECLARTGRVREAREQLSTYMKQYPDGLWAQAANERLGSASGRDTGKR